MTRTNRATYPWADQGGKPDADMLASFKQIIGLRNQHAVLRRGTIDAPLHVDDHTIVLLRQLGSNVAITATNNATTPQTVKVKLPLGVTVAQFSDVLGGGAVTAVHGELNITLPRTIWRRFARHRPMTTRQPIPGSRTMTKSISCNAMLWGRHRARRVGILRRTVRG
jgi:hypothetical protein